VDVIPPQKRRLTRETRLLFVTIAVSVAALWVLARIRFADAPGPPNPITPVLTQLAPTPVFDQLSAAMVQVQSRMSSLLVGVDVTKSPLSIGHDSQSGVTALRIDGDSAIAMFNGELIRQDVDLAPGIAVTGHDPASGLTLLRVVSSAPTTYIPATATWSPRQPQSARYLVAGELASGEISARPVFVASIEAMTSRLWADLVWGLPAATDVRPGSFMFTTDGVLAGLVSDIDGRLVIVPPETLRSAVDRLVAQGPREYGQLGIAAQALTPAVSSSTRVPIGVVVTWVDPKGPAAGRLDVGDVIVSIADEPLSTYEHWRAVSARLGVGQTIAVRVQRGSQVRTEGLTAVAATAREPVPLGLTLRRVQEVGSEVVSVGPGSTAGQAGLLPGDVITLFGDRKAPAPAVIERVFATASTDRPILVAVTRNGSHHVLALEKR
jgi:hypothetical protein